MIPESIDDLSVIATNNVPQGGDNVGGTLDDILRAHATIMKRDLALKKAETAAGTSFTPTDRLISKNVQAALNELGEKIGDINLEWSEIKGKPPTFAPSAHNHSWAEITGKPSNFTPSSHTHEWSQVSGIPDTATRWPSWGEVTGKPSTFRPPTGQGAVGTYAMVRYLGKENNWRGELTTSFGGTISGSQITANDTNQLSGTWRVMQNRLYYIHKSTTTSPYVSISANSALAVRIS